jgi:LysM repeat protein
MSEQAPEQSGSGGGKLGVWSKKLGPLPAYVWAVLVLGIVLVVMYIKKKKTASAASGASDTGSADGTDASDIPQFVNQTYTTVTPPTVNASATSSSTSTASNPTPSPPCTSPTCPAPVGTPTPVSAPPNPPKAKAPTKSTAKPKPIAVVVKPGDTLTSIAKKYGISWETLYDYNIGSSSPHTPSAIAYIKSHGPNLIYAGETFYIPPKTT